MPSRFFTVAARIVALLVCCTAGLAAAQTYPAKPVRVVVPTPAAAPAARSARTSWRRRHRTATR